jgi:hypothetical protein
MHATRFSEKEKSASFLSRRHGRVFSTSKPINRCIHKGYSKLKFSHSLAKHREGNWVIRTQRGKRRTKLSTIRLVRIQASRQNIADRLVTEFVKSSIGPLHSHRRRKRNTRAANRRHIKLAEIDDGFTGQHLLVPTHENLHSRSDRKIELCSDSGIARFLDQASSANGLRLKTGAGDGTVTDTRETRSLRQFSRRNVSLSLKQMLEVGITRREPGCSFRGRENKTLRIIERIS